MTYEIFPKSEKDRSILFYGYVLALFIAALVYIAGGTVTVYGHMMYIPIAAVSNIKGKHHGFIHAFFCALIIGPFMPANVDQSLYQKPVDCIFRVVFFLSFSMIIHTFSYYHRNQKERIENILTHDAITGLRNLEAMKREEHANGAPKTILVLSVKNMEETTNYFGYLFYNHILESFIDKLREILKAYPEADLYRSDGMQFVLTISRSGIPDCGELLEELQRLDRSVIVVDQIPVFVEIRIGISNTGSNVSLIEGLRQAMTAHNFARAGDMKTCYFTPDIESYYRELLEIAGGFSGALKSKQIKAAYQFLVSAKTEERTGVEILARWENPGMGTIRPDLFISVLEQTLQIRELTKHMITCAMDYLVFRRGDHFTVSLNFAQKDFNDEILDFLFERIERDGIDPSKVRIEVVERVFIEIQELIPFLERLRSRGIQIALDDFGTGYSSFQHLSELPVDLIKIDKSLVMNLVNNPAGKSLIRSIVDFCRENHIQTVAEGVETREIAGICKEIGFDYLQGYYYHKPEVLDPEGLKKQKQQREELENKTEEFSTAEKQFLAT